MNGNDSNRGGSVRSNDIVRFRFKGILVRVGGFFFRHRDILPIPLFIILLVFMMPGPINWLIGVLLISIGESMRFYTLLYIGPESRTRGSEVRRLVTAGPFSHVRNPLYLGNFIISSGIVVISNIKPLILIFPLIFFFYYHLIVLWEEEILSERFGKVYEDYKEKVSRWLPSLRRRVYSKGSTDLLSAVRSEKKTILTLLAIISMMLVRNFLPL